MILWRILRRLLALFVVVLVNYRRTLLVGVVLLFGGINAVGNFSRIQDPRAVSALVPTTSGARSAAPAAPVTGRPVSLEQAPPSVESYIKGLIEFDARLMWSSLSEEAITAMRSRGGSLEALQQGLDEAKRRGAKYEAITPIGNYTLNDGSRYIFYVLSRRGFTGPDQLDQVYFVFTVAKDGKITRIE